MPIPLVKLCGMSRVAVQRVMRAMRHGWKAYHRDQFGVYLTLSGWGGLGPQIRISLTGVVYSHGWSF